MTIRTKISPPWIIYLRKLTALFENDQQVRIVYDNSERKIKLLVDEPMKAAALDYLLPKEAVFGNATLQIVVIPANQAETEFDPAKDLAKTFDVVFKGNPVYAFSHKVEGMFSYNMTYIVFKNRVVQFFADNLNDLHGNISTLYQYIAGDVFRNDLVVSFCTDVEEKVGMPLGEWP